MKIPNEVKVGILGVTALVILFFGYNFLRGRKVFASDIEYVAVFDKVDGLLVANPVQISGVPVGLVESIDRSSDVTAANRVEVHFTVSKNTLVPPNTTIQIISVGLMGEKALLLTYEAYEKDIALPHNKVKKVVDLTNVKSAPEGHVFVGVSEIGMMETAKNILNEQVTPMKDKALLVADTLKETLSHVNTVLASGQIQETLNNLNKTLVGLQKTIKTIDGAALSINNTLHKDLPKVSNILANVEAVSGQLQGSTTKLNSVLENTNTATKKLAELEIKQTVDKLNGSLAEAQNLIKKINSTEGSMGMLMNDKQLYHNLEALTHNLNELLVDFQTHPKDYVGVSLININKGRKKDPDFKPTKSEEK